jgi:hypothetical protein
MPLIKLNNQSLSAVTSAGLPSGTVLQVVSNSFSTSTSITSNTQGSGTSTGLTATIIPASTNNKLLLTGTVHFGTGYSADPNFSLEIYDGSSIIYTDNGGGYYFNGDGNEAYSTRMPIHAYIDAPSTSSTTYTVRAFKSSSTSLTAQNNSNPSILSIMEIAG